jgi:CheY-like chemotaxis protein
MPAPHLVSPDKKENNVEFKVKRKHPPEKKLNLLLVDDNHISRQVGRDILAKLGYQVTTAENGRMGIQTFNRERFDLVLMDLEMPEMDGFEAARIIRQHAAESGLRVPIIALTAHVFEDVLKKCRETGMEGHIAKPYSLATLNQEIDRIMKPEASGCPPCPPPNRQTSPKTHTGVILDMGREMEEARDNPSGKEMRLPETPRHVLDQAFNKLGPLRMLIAATSAGQAAAQLNQLKQLTRQLGAEGLTDEIFRLQMMVRKEEWEQCKSQLLAIETELKQVEKQMTREKTTP